MNSTTTEAPRPAVATAVPIATPAPPTALPLTEAQGLFGPTVSTPVSRLAPNTAQPRKSFPEEELKQLAATIRLHGILEPLLCLSGEGGFLTILVGERRYRAALLADLRDVPVRVAVRPLAEADILELQLIENNARQDLPALELAQGLLQLKRLRPRPLNELAAAVGLHVSSVSRLLSLLKLPEAVRAMLAKGELTPAVAGEIAKLKGGEAVKLALAEKAAHSGLSRDAVAALVARCNAGRNAPSTVKSKPARRIALHVEEQAVELTLSAEDGKQITLEIALAALEAAAKRARRLYQGAGDLADLIACFAKHKPGKQNAPTIPCPHNHQPPTVASAGQAQAKPGSEAKEGNGRD